MDRDSLKSRSSWNKAWEIIDDVLHEKRPFTDLAQFAVKAASVHKGMVAAESHMETNRLILGKQIYGDEKKFEEYVRKSLPQMLTEKK